MIQIKTTGGGMPHHAMIPNAQAERDKPESVIRPHLLRFVIPSCFLPALVRLPASALSLHLDVARYAFDETSAHLLNNRTKSDKDSNDRFGINHAHTTEKKQPLEKTLSTNLTYRKEKSYSWFSAK